jgi:ubiquinone/menaquinone biosynthesis C-methylase UbiE
MGPAQAQGHLWGVQARNWADLMEKMQLPIYHVVFDKTNVGRGTRLLDVGCGTGMAAQLAAQLGAHVTGLDASETELVIARERVSNSDFRCGDMEELPYADASFDVVTGFSSFQFAEDPLNALRQAKRVAKPGGYVAMVAWGRVEDCEFATTLKAVMACLPPPLPGARGTFALSEPGKMEALMEQAELTVCAYGDVSCPFEYPDDETAWKTISSSGPLVATIRTAGEATIKQAVLTSLVPFKTPGGGYRQEHRLRVERELAVSLSEEQQDTTNATSPLSMIHIHQLGGAMNRVGADATAFGHRDSGFVVNVLGMWPAPEDNEKHIDWARGLFAALQPYAHGAYINFLGDEGQERVRSAYGPNYERLVALKNKYDPSNLFRLNQNIPPAFQAKSSEKP